MSSLTHAKKAALLKKVDESIGPIGPYRYRLRDAIRGGVLVDAVYILLDLHRKTEKGETKALIEASEHEYTISQLRQQLANAEADIADYQKADEHNHALFRERGTQIRELEEQLAEVRQKLADEQEENRFLERTCHDYATEDAHVALQDYMDFHRDDSWHIMSLSAQVKELKAELAAAHEEIATLKADAEEFEKSDEANQAHYAETCRELAAARASLTAAQAELASAQAQLDTERQDNGHLNMTIRELIETIDEHRQSALDWRARAHAFSEENLTLRYGPAFRQQATTTAAEHKKLVYGVALQGLPAEDEHEE